MIKTTENLLGTISTMMEANGWHKEWVKISTTGMMLAGWSKDGLTFTMSIEGAEYNGVLLPDTSDLYVD